VDDDYDLVDDDVEITLPPETHPYEDERKIEEQPADQMPSSMLPAPTLDLSHIDRRNRPFLVWTESYGATHYHLQESDEPDFLSPKEFTVKVKETRWNPRIKRSGRLFYRVRAANEDEDGHWSNVLSIRMG
jgi:hypothetical protein